MSFQIPPINISSEFTDIDLNSEQLATPTPSKSQKNLHFITTLFFYIISCDCCSEEEDDNSLPLLKTLKESSTMRKNLNL